MSVNIQLEWTPNPSTLKYVVDTKLLPRGAMNFTDKAAAVEKSPLVAKLFGIKGVLAVMVGTNFVTVTKGDDGEWDELNDGVMSMLDQHLTAGEEVVKAEFLEAKAATVAIGTPRSRAVVANRWRKEYLFWALSIRSAPA